MALWMAMSHGRVLGSEWVVSLVSGSDMLRPCHASQGADVVASLLNAPEEVSMEARVSYPRTGSQLAFARVATALAFVSVRALAIGAWLSDAWRLALLPFAKAGSSVCSSTSWTCDGCTFRS